MPTLNKIDDQGNYLEFPGVTIVADAGQTNSKLWQEIYFFLKNTPILCDYFSPLPSQSYHMTTCNLYTKEETPEDWVSFISKKMTFFQKINKRLSELKLAPVVSIETIDYFSELQLILSVPPEQKTIIQQIAKEFGLENKVPGVFHITLAYGYREINDEQIFKEIKSKIVELLKICQQYDKDITLSPPKLCFFRSMEQFIPWDGTANPFIAKSTPDLFSLFGYRNKTQKNEVPSPSVCPIM
ncbi:Uncharacterized protein conserved in bacteria [Legionella steigerwaltii]|uniref:Uncharacterized protein conserved in bacteria n=1 Tax=Legionella steigerwaltii TaxID=460 RepID=A0A378L7R4_9GAMM|nr:DUF1868 domain-containing protein [Legionella steigerwaltii]KTD72128.1 hypothetical protein Lstg_2639 [Legionella steigerwaltii]STY21888.1 Uncharacterized protein conserved in bacteria [Legionella steigerwaltii]